MTGRAVRRPQKTAAQISAREKAEQDLLAKVIALCAGRDLWVVRVPAERFAARIADNRGFPDVAVFGPGGALFRELKLDRNKNTLRTSQTVWKHRLISGAHDWAIWTPSDLESGLIDRELADVETGDEHTDFFSLSMARPAESTA